MYNFKDRETLVQDVINYLTPRLPENTVFNDGEPLRDIIEAIMNELDIQYWQLEQVYNNGYIDSSYGEDVDKVVAILGIERNRATRSRGSVIFYRDSPADRDYFIPRGTSVETLANKDGISIQFSTLEDAFLRIGETQVSVLAECVLDGEIGNIPPNTISIINNPPLGIESVRNDEGFSGGEEEESDESLKERAKTILDAVGLGTIDALYFKVRDIPGVRNVLVRDLARGIGTVDILVLGDVIPLPQNKLDEINNVIMETKSGGIDVLLLEPEVIYVNIDFIMYLAEDSNPIEIEEKVTEAIESYINNLNIGERLILNQLRRHILNADINIEDIKINNPTENISISENQIIRIGDINISLE